MPIDLTDRIIQPLPKPAVKLHPIRRTSQVAIGFALILLPLLNLFRVDLPAGRFWLLGHSLTAQNLFLLFYGCVAGVVLLIGVSLFYGRWWCGWVCPQTLASDFGDSLRVRIDKMFRANLGGVRRFVSGSLWTVTMLAMAVATAATMLSYFYPPARVWHAVFQPLSDTRITWHLALVSAVIGADLLWVRRHFCRRGCPYGLMLSLIGDRNTMTVRYLWERDDDCIECGKCVTICPMEIDIKHGPNQMECIGCGECIDACNDVLPMLKAGPKAGLIELRYGVDPMRLTSRLTVMQRIGLWDGKRVFVSLVTFALFLGFINELFGTHATSVTVASHGTITQAGSYLFETYDVNIANGKPSGEKFLLSASGIDRLFLDRASLVVNVARSAERTIVLTVGAPVNTLIPGRRYPITIGVQSMDGEHSLHSSGTIFYVPNSIAQLKAG